MHLFSEINYNQMWIWNLHEIWGSDASIGARSKESLVITMLALIRKSFILIETDKERRSMIHKRIRSENSKYVRRERVPKPINREARVGRPIACTPNTYTSP